VTFEDHGFTPAIEDLAKPLFTLTITRNDRGNLECEHRFNGLPFIDVLHALVTSAMGLAEHMAADATDPLSHGLHPVIPCALQAAHAILDEWIGAHGGTSCNA
jgi:hypothetical protein